MNDRNCMTCKYEPEWGPVTKGDYPRCSGACKWNDPMPVTPASIRIVREPIVRFTKDNSGIHTNCRAWQQKAPISVTTTPTKPDECRDGCPPNQVCDFCQGTGGEDKKGAA